MFAFRVVERWNYEGVLRITLIVDQVGHFALIGDSGGRDSDVTKMRWAGRITIAVFLRDQGKGLLDRDFQLVGV